MKNTVERFYDQVHEQNKAYASAVYDTQALLGKSAVSTWMKKRAGASVRMLDVGCGKGVFMRDVARGLRDGAGIGLARVAGVDLVRSPNDVFAEVGTHVEFVEQSIDGTPLPFPDGSFDVVFCNHVLEHVFRTEFVIREMRRVLAPGGLCVISVPNLASWVNRVALLFAIQPLGTEIGTESITYGFRPSFLQRKLGAFTPAGHIRDFTPLGLADLCRGAGFAPVGWWNQDERWWLRLSPWAGRMMGIILE